LRNKHIYWSFPGVLDKEFCDYVISEGLKQSLQDGETGGQKQKKDNTTVSLEDRSWQEVKSNKIKNVHVRDSKVSWLNDKYIFDTVFSYIKAANQNAGWNYDILGCEKAQFTTYNAPGGFYGWHNDGGSCHYSVYKRHIPGVTDTFVDESLKKVKSGYTMNNDLIGSVRKLSVTISLTDSNTYEGGNLKFDLGENADVENRFIECTEIRPQGSIIVFPSYNLHQVTPVTKGTRYSLVIWYYGRPFR